MTDLLAERFAAITDPVDADWLDVRRRARRARRRVWVGVAFAAAALAAVTAVLAAEGWIFSKQPDGALGQTTLQFHDATYRLTASAVTDGGRFLTLGLARGSRYVAWASGNYVLAAPGVPNEPGLADPPPPAGRPVAGNAYRQGGGEIAFGDARPGVGRVVLTDQHGQAFSTRTVTFPARTPSALRVWVIALPSSTARTITAYDVHGRKMFDAPFYPTRQISLH